MNYKLVISALVFTSLLSAEAKIESKKVIATQTAKDSFTKAPNSITPMPQMANKLTIEQATLKAINEARSKNQICSKAVKPLRWNKTLYYRAKEHTIDMVVTKMLKHNGSGQATDKTAKKLGLNRGSFFYERVNQKIEDKTLYSGELIIRTSESTLKSPKELINYWIKRPNDCKVIMNTTFSDVALAKVISNTDNRAYWTLLLAGAKKKH